MVVTFTCSSDRRTRIGTTFSPEKKQKQKQKSPDNMYIKQYFQTLDIKNCRAVIPERRKINELTPVIASADTWRFQITTQGGKSTACPEVSLGWGNRPGSPERPKWVKSIKHSTREEQVAQRESLEIKRGFPLRFTFPLEPALGLVQPEWPYSFPCHQC